MGSKIVEERALPTLIEETLLPYVLKKAQESSPGYRMWSIGCQAGDEALLLWLGLVSCDGVATSRCSFTLFVTDPDQCAVTAARRLTTSKELLSRACLSPYKRMFEDRGQGMGLSASLRESLIFAPHDLVSHPPFPRLDLIVCHLPFSVFTSSQQSSILNRFAYALLPHGLLVLLSPGEISPDPLLYSRHDKSLFPTYSRTVAPVSLSTLGWGRTPAALSLVSSPPQRVSDEDTEAVLEELQVSLEEREVLCQELEERAQVLSQAYRELQKLDQLKDEFLSLVSHELRTPLTILLTRTQLLQRTMRHQEEMGALQATPQEFKASVSTAIDTILSQGQAINSMLTSMLDQARLHADIFVLQPITFDLVTLLDQLVTQQRMLTARPLRLEGEEAPLMVTMDKDRLAQVITNLLENALKYSASETEVRISVSATEPDAVLIGVHDQGEGISEDDLAHLFDRFYRVQRHGGQGRKGLGLGLYIAAEIVKRHGGRIWVGSTRGVGSSFFVALPLRSSLYRIEGGQADVGRASAPLA